MTRASTRPAAQAVTTNTRSAISHIARSSPQENGERQIDAGRLQTVVESGPDAGKLVPALHPPVGLDPLLLEVDDILHRDDVAFHPRDLGDLGHAPDAVGVARHVYDHVDGGGDLLANRARRQV